MMKKLFNKKAMIAYIIVLAITFIAGCSMIGVNVHLWSKKMDRESLKN